MMKRNIVAAAVAGVFVVAPMSSALADSKLVASIRIGLQYLDTDANDGEVDLTNFGSRLIWTGSNTINDSLEGIARIELGLNPDQNAGGSNRTGGIDRTRQLWAGVQGGFGSIKWGAQYAAFYDMVQSNTDIAWWGSCFQQFECSRETQVLKYSGGVGDLSYSASFEARPDAEEEFFDELEFGVNYGFGGWTVGLATSISADSLNDDGTENDGGVLVGGVVKGDIGPVSLAVTLQTADEDFADSADNVSHFTVAGTFGNFYALWNQGDADNADPNFGTVGYTLNLGDNALMYYELQTLDNDAPGVDSTTIGRATFKYDF